jgi:predicted RNase H-like nuclease
LAATAKLQGITLSPEEPQVFPSLVEVLDYKPAYQVIALFAPIGLLESPSVGGRKCDRDARRILGWPRSGAVISAPARGALGRATYEEASSANGGRLSIVAWQLLKKVTEVDVNMAPYWQRTVFEVHPELSFYQLNADQPVRYGKHTQVGLEERQALLQGRLPGVERILGAKMTAIVPTQLVDAAACLWTARRIVSRAVTRLPEDPEWDTMGLRMEIVR